MVAEQTHGNKQVRAQEKYLAELQESEAYKLLRYAYNNCMLDSYFDDVVGEFLRTGIVNGLNVRELYLNDR